MGTGRSLFTRTLIAAGQIVVLAAVLAACAPDGTGLPETPSPTSAETTPTETRPTETTTALPQPTGPSPVVMICAFQDADGTGWVPEVVIVTRQSTGRIEVFDPILQALVGRPIKAEVTADSPRERHYGWALAGVRNAVGQWTERLDFRLAVIKSDSRAILSVKAQGYDNTITGNGICGQPPQRRG